MLESRTMYHSITTHIITHADGSCGIGFAPLRVCFPHSISQKPMQLGPQNLTQKCSTTRTGNPFILWSKGQTSMSRFTVWVFAWSSELYNLERVNHILIRDGKGFFHRSDRFYESLRMDIQDNDSCSCIYDPDPKRKLLCDENPLMMLTHWSFFDH